MATRLIFRSARRGAGGEAGYSLIEMMVAMTVIAAITVFALPATRAALPGLALRDAGQKLAETAREARRDAIAGSRESWIEIDLAARAYRRASGDWRALPEAADLRFVTARQESLGPDYGLIRFFPGGGSTGGVVTLTNDERQVEVRVDWLTGAAALVSGAAGR